MIQASTTLEPSIRLEREEHRVAIAHSRAAPRPPMMAVTVGSVQGAAGLRGLPRDDGAWAGVRTAAGPARRVAAGPPLPSARRCRRAVEERVVPSAFARGPGSCRMPPAIHLVTNSEVLPPWPRRPAPGQ